MSKRPFLIEGDPAKEVIDRWAKQGIACELNDDGTGINVRNYSWPTESLEVSPEALDELGEHYDAILAHLRYWRETRSIVERIGDQSRVLPQKLV